MLWLSCACISYILLCISCLRYADNSTDNERSILIGEINLMKTLEPHPHVIQMVGCSITEEKVALIMEYCHRGNLREHLRENNSNFQVIKLQQMHRCI